MSMNNFYDTLGVTETSTQDEIKKAYRKLAIEHHPDKGGDEDKFKKISEAYNILGDETKRSQYDNQRQNPFGNMGGGGFNPFEDLFNGAFHTQRRRSVPDKVIEVQVGAIESFMAGDKIINYSRQHMCNDCSGQGGERETCNVCNGDGFIALSSIPTPSGSIRLASPADNEEFARVLYQAPFDARFRPGPRQILSNLDITSGLKLRITR